MKISWKCYALNRDVASGKMADPTMSLLSAWNFSDPRNVEWKNMIRWFAQNDIAANLLLIAIVLFGGYCLVERVPFQVQPTMEFRHVDVNVEYRGGAPEDVEQAILIPVENALQGLSGVDSIVSSAYGGGGRVQVLANRQVDVKELRDEVKTRISRIDFPPEVEAPEISIPDSDLWFDVIKVVVAGEMDEADLLKAARRVRDDLIALPGISQASVLGNSPMEISVEADPRRLRDFGLGFADLTEAIRKSSVDLPAGQILTEEGSLVIRSKGQAYDRQGFEDIVITNRDGSEVRLGTVAEVRDGFEESRKILRFNGTPCLLVEVLRLDGESAVEIAKRTREYVAAVGERFPDGVRLDVWDDSSIELKGRIRMLLINLLQGSFLVLLCLGLFLRPAIAFWVTVGIPVSFAGGFILMPWLGMTVNVMSLFGFIIVIGLIVDDAIVTAENVYQKLRDGEAPLDAATEGAREVAVPVTFGVLTTIVAFLPLMFFDGFYGNYTRQIPPVVAAVLFFSLVESKLCLPAHLKHVKVGHARSGWFARFQRKVAHGLEDFVRHVYEPALRRATHHRAITISLFLALGMAAVGYFQSGKLGFVNMPSIDRNRIIACVQMPRDTTSIETDKRVRLIESKVERLRHEFVDRGTGKSLIGDVLPSSGGWAGRPSVDSHMGFVVLTVMDPGERSEPGPKNSEIASRWTELVGEVPGARSFWITGDRGGGFRGGGRDELEYLTIEVRGNASPARDRIVDEVGRMLESYDGIDESWDNGSGSRDELRITIRPEGEALGLTQQAVARQVRAAFFGEQAQKFQRDRDSIRVMVRMPGEMRRSLQTLNHLRIRTPEGGEAPFHSVADAKFARGRSNIERIDGAQTVTVNAKPVDDTVDVVAISKDLKPKLQRLFYQDPDLSWRFTGYVAEHEETKRRSYLGGAALLIGLYALLAIPFRSLYQPLLVLLAIPFGLIGALLGHLLLNITPSYLSIFGLLALAGVVINDSLVMVEYANRKIQEGMPVVDAVVAAGARRFRPILLTSLTTFAGLLPIILDHSLQAQFLIPMAVSLAFGILFGTVITLFLIPAAYVLAEDVRSSLRKFRAVGDAEDPTIGGGS